MVSRQGTCTKMFKGYNLLSRTGLQKLDHLAKQLTPASKLINSKSFTSTRNPQNFNLSNSFVDSDYRKQISLANLFQRYGIPSSILHDFIAKKKSLLNVNVSELENSLGILLISLKLQQNLVVSLVCDCPNVLELEFLKKWEVVIVKLRPFAISPGALKSVLEVSRRLKIDPDRFSGCIQVLRGLGFSDGTVNRVLEEFPGVVMMNERDIQEKLDFWTVQGVEKEAIDKIYHLIPRVLGHGLQNRLKPLLNELMELGFERRLVTEEIVREPRILCLEVGEFRLYLEFLRKLNCKYYFKEKIFNKGEFRAGLLVKHRIDFLCGYGLTRRDALHILKKEPKVMIYNIMDIEKKVKFLLDRMKFTVDSLIDVPRYLGVNFENQIVPRYSVIEYLRSIGGLGFEPGLKHIIKPSRHKFHDFYVKPYPECEKLYGRNAVKLEPLKGHPVGLWKCFKPPKYPESEEDVKNLKLFAEQLV